MDMMQGLIAANAPIGQQNAVGSFLAGQKASLDAAKTQQDVRAQQYQQNLKEQLQQAIHESVDPTSGNIDPDKFKVAAHKHGVDPQAIDYALDNVLKVWDTARKVGQAKTLVGAQTDKGAAEVESANKPAGTSWANQKRGSLAAPVPSTKPEDDKTGFTTPDMLPQDKVNIKGVGIEGEGQTAQDQTFTLAPEVPADTVTPPKVPGVVEAISSMQPRKEAPEAPVASADNPFQVTGMDKATQDNLLSSLRQEGKIGAWNAKNPDGTPMKRADYLSQAQAALDAVYARSKGTLGKAPTEQMYIDKEGLFDQGAFERAKSDYQARKAATEAAYVKEIGSKYGEMFAQQMTEASNRRAETQLATEQAKIKSAGTAVEESADNINSQLKPYGFKNLSPLLLQNADAGQKEVLKNGAKSYATVVDLSRKLVEEKRNPTVAEVNGATNQIMALDGMGSNLSNEEKVSALSNKGFLDKIYQATLGNKPTGEAIQSAVAQTLLARMTKGETLEDIAKNTSYTKLHQQFEGETGAFAGPGWTNKPRKKKAAPVSTPASTGRKPGESMSDYYRRVGK